MARVLENIVLRGRTGACGGRFVVMNRNPASIVVAVRNRLARPAGVALLILASLAVAGCGSGGTDLASSQSVSATSSQSTANSAAALINTGIAQANAKQYREAETTFRDVLVVSPNNKFAWYNLGLLAQVQNKSSAALAAYAKALSIDPKYTPAMYNKAILTEGKNLRSALALYQQITSINPKAATAFLRESFVYERLGDKTRAKQARDRAVALDGSLATVTSPAP
jgi:tetratricopeptide (TPR) repeat protein